MGRRVSEPLTRSPILTRRFTSTTIRPKVSGEDLTTISNAMRFHSSAYTYTASSNVFQNDVETQDNFASRVE